MISLNGHALKEGSGITHFPDKTSQVWKIDPALLDAAYKAGDCRVVWDFEYEGEIVQLAQLKSLLDASAIDADLSMPYLPYGRQDKRVSNETTFGLHTFAKMINAMAWRSVETIDAHNNLRASAIFNLTDVGPKKQIAHALSACKAERILFPDASASKRYDAYQLAPSVYAEKVRVQSTGEITGLEIIGNCRIKDKAVLIVDDICDGGRTFVEAAKAAYAAGAREVHLYVTHGIFSRGLKPLQDAGIKRIFTRKGELAAYDDAQRIFTYKPMRGGKK